MFGLVMAACSSGSPQVTPSSTTLPPSEPVRLVAASTELQSQCAAAANRLGFAVPCPAQVPTLAGQGMTCPASQGGMRASCVGGLDGFFLELSGFDVPSGYVGADGKATGHLIVEANRHDDRPPIPCIGGKRVAKVVAGSWTTTEYRCPNDSFAVQREARHGEGAHAGHLLLEWSRDGIDYIASAHGHTTVNLDLLKRLVGSMTLIPPGTA